MTELLVERSTLLDAATFASKALPRNALHPVLTGLRMTSDDGSLTVSAFDYDTYAAAKVSADGSKFDVLLPGATLVRYLGGMTGERVSIVPGEREVALTCGPSRVILPRLSIQDYPSPPDLPADVGEVNATALIGALRSVRPAIGPNTGRAQQRGFVALLGEHMTLAGIHTQRFAVREVEWSGTGEGHAIIPVAALDGVGAMSGDVLVGLDAGRLSLVDESHRIVVRLIEAEPDNFVPMLTLHGITTTVTFDREELANALRWLVLGDTRKQGHGTLRFGVNTDSVGLALAGADLDAETQIEAKVDGDPLVMGWKAENLLYGLAATDADTVSLAIQSPTKAALLTAADDPSLRYLTMPWRFE